MYFGKWIFYYSLIDIPANYNMNKLQKKFMNLSLFIQMSIIHFDI